MINIRSTLKTVNAAGYRALPDFSVRECAIPDDVASRIHELLEIIYPDRTDRTDIFDEICRIMLVHHAYKTPELVERQKMIRPSERFTERDTVLITYGDLIKTEGMIHLTALGAFCRRYLRKTFTGVHILPFFPYSSDRGFSVIDYEVVDPHLGAWDHIDRLREDFRLMFDGVINHVSSHSKWFRAFLHANASYTDYFITFDPEKTPGEELLKLVTRPRTSPVLSEFDTLSGKKMVWTTFSRDQVDLNYANPVVLIRMLAILLFYVRQGADMLRLDAVTYLWKELGTNCVHLPETHAVIKLLRVILDMVAPEVAIITETNVPHTENISYFGEGDDEAQLVYNFALPPLVVHSFLTGRAVSLSNWAATLDAPSKTTTFFNFLDSHDGIGLMAVKDILPPDEIELMALQILEHGGFISYKSNADGTTSPYEMNTTWFGAINNENRKERTEMQVRRYLASRAIALVLAGVPGIYLHGLLGTRNRPDDVLTDRQTRSINRSSVDGQALEKSLRMSRSLTSKIFWPYMEMIKKRQSLKAFHPNAPQRVLKVNPGVFTVLRTSLDKKQRIIALTNVSDTRVEVEIRHRHMRNLGERWQDVFTGRVYRPHEDDLTVAVDPYGVLWLKEEV